MGERAQELPFVITIDDNGSVVLGGFESRLKQTEGKAKKSANVMTRAFSRLSQKSGLAAIDSSSSTRLLLLSTSKMPP